MRNLYQKLTNVLLSAFIMLISFNASATNYYVDGSVSSSGDGLSWATAFKTISEAVSLSLSGGDAVYIQPGLYHEQITIHASGTSILAATANISVSAGGIVQFPSGTNLSAIDLIGHPDEYYAYVARSMKSNNGVYKIIAVDDANDRITVELTGDDFLAESGTAGDLYSLSAAIVRPIRHINASATPETQRVIIEGDAGMNGAVYIGANNTGDDAIPANYNLMDGFDITGIPAGFGLNITCSMYNAILNTNIYENGSSDKGGGVIVNGHDPFLASYNFFERVKIYDVNCEGAYLGNGNHTPEYNVTNFNHLIDCEFYQTHPPLNFENGPDLKEDNTGTVIEGCLFHDLTLSSAYNGVINVFERNTHVMIYGNEFYNINSYLVSSEDIYNAYVVTYQEIDNLMFFNNILRSPGNVNSTFHALYFHDTNIDNAYFAFNTITGFNNCIMQDGGGSSMHVMSNIFDCDNYTDWGSGSYNFSNNLFKVAPPWGLGTGDIVGTPGFVGGGDYHLTSSSIARNAGTQTTPVVPLDFDLLPRDVTPDIGAYEFQSTIIIASTSSLPAFPQTAIATSSTAQSFTASGTGLTANITVTAPAEFEVSLTEGSGYGSSVTLTQSGGTVATTTIYARFSPTTVGNKSGNIVLSSTGATSVNVAVSGEAVAVLTPTIIASTATLPAFPQTVIATSSAAQSFTASGTGLTANITVTAPAEFEVSLTEGSGYGSSVTLTQSGGTVATTTIYARFSPTTVGNKSGNIVLSSTGATSVNVAVSGEAVAVLTPTIIASTATLPAFPQTAIATSSAAQSFTASGTGLTANITVSAPAEFEVSLTEGSGYGSSVTLTQSGGTVATTTIYARFSPTNVGNKAGNIVLSSTGATSVNVAVSGEAVMPTTSARYYVDAAVSSSGDGLSWATAFKTLTEATSMTLEGGDIVYIKPGTYVEHFEVSSNGTLILPNTTGISVTPGHVVQFPAGTNLSGIDITTNPDDYYVFVSRSWASNNGVFKILTVDDANDQITVDMDGDDFVAETGTNGDANYLSAAIVRPVKYLKYSSNPTIERVTVEGLPGAYEVITIGKDNLTGYDAIPANYNLLDGIDAMGSPNGFGLNIVSSNFNIYQNADIYDNENGGVYIDGNNQTPGHTAYYNFISNCKIYDCGLESFYIGAEGKPIENSHAHYNHFIDCDIYQTNQAASICENIIDFKEYTIGNVMEGCLLHDTKLVSNYNGYVNLFHDCNHTLFYGNEIYNISTKTTGYYFAIVTYENADNFGIFNNVIRQPGSPISSNFRAIYIHANNCNNSQISFNTITGYAKALLIEGNGSGITLKSNIINCNTIVTDWGYSNPQFFNNLYKVNPNFYPTEPGRIIGDPGFVNATSDLHLLSTSLARDAGIAATPPISYDFDQLPRDVTPDIGAYEYQNPLITVSTATLPAFPQTVIATSSAAQSFTASGTGLTANITVTAPAEFEVSLTEGSGYGSSVTLTQSGGTVATTTIYVRFSPTTVGNKSGNIVLSSTGATSVNVAVSGEAVGIPGLWTGAVSTDWNLAANWHNNSVPDATIDVRVPDGLSRYPIVGTTTNAVCKSVQLEGIATLEINGTLTTAH